MSMLKPSATRPHSKAQVGGRISQIQDEIFKTDYLQSEKKVEHADDDELGMC